MATKQKRKHYSSSTTTSSTSEPSARHNTVDFLSVRHYRHTNPAPGSYGTQGGTFVFHEPVQTGAEYGFDKPPQHTKSEFHPQNSNATSEEDRALKRQKLERKGGKREDWKVPAVGDGAPKFKVFAPPPSQSSPADGSTSKPPFQAPQSIVQGIKQGQSQFSINSPSTNDGSSGRKKNRLGKSEDTNGVSHKATKGHINFKFQQDQVLRRDYFPEPTFRQPKLQSQSSHESSSTETSLPINGDDTHREESNEGDRGKKARNKHGDDLTVREYKPPQPQQQADSQDKHHNRDTSPHPQSPPGKPFTFSSLDIRSTPHPPSSPHQQHNTTENPKSISAVTTIPPRMDDSPPSAPSSASTPPAARPTLFTVFSRHPADSPSRNRRASSLSEISKRFWVFKCERCRRMKQKCDIQRPICSRCEKAGVNCVYPSRPLKHGISKEFAAMGGSLHEGEDMGDGDDDISDEGDGEGEDDVDEGHENEDGPHSKFEIFGENTENADLRRKDNIDSRELYDTKKEENFLPLKEVPVKDEFPQKGHRLEFNRWVVGVGEEREVKRPALREGNDRLALDMIPARVEEDIEHRSQYDAKISHDVIQAKDKQNSQEDTNGTIPSFTAAKVIKFRAERKDSSTTSTITSSNSEKPKKSSTVSKRKDIIFLDEGTRFENGSVKGANHRYLHQHHDSNRTHRSSSPNPNPKPKKENRDKVIRDSSSRDNVSRENGDNNDSGARDNSNRDNAREVNDPTTHENSTRDIGARDNNNRDVGQDNGNREPGRYNDPQAQALYGGTLTPGFDPRMGPPLPSPAMHSHLFTPIPPQAMPEGRTQDLYYAQNSDARLQQQRFAQQEQHDVIFPPFPHQATTAPLDQLHREQEDSWPRRENDYGQRQHESWDDPRRFDQNGRIREGLNNVYYHRSPSPMGPHSAGAPGNEFSAFTRVNRDNYDQRQPPYGHPEHGYDGAIQYYGPQSSQPPVPPPPPSGQYEFSGDFDPQNSPSRPSFEVYSFEHFAENPYHVTLRSREVELDIERRRAREREHELINEQSRHIEGRPVHLDYAFPPQYPDATNYHREQRPYYSPPLNNIYHPLKDERDKGRSSIEEEHRHQMEEDALSLILFAAAGDRRQSVRSVDSRKGWNAADGDAEGLELEEGSSASSKDALQTQPNYDSETEYAATLLSRCFAHAHSSESSPTGTPPPEPAIVIEGGIIFVPGRKILTFKKFGAEKVLKNEKKEEELVSHKVMQPKQSGIRAMKRREEN